MSARYVKQNKKEGKERREAGKREMEIGGTNAPANFQSVEVLIRQCEEETCSDLHANWSASPADRRSERREESSRPILLRVSFGWNSVLNRFTIFNIRTQYAQKNVTSLLRKAITRFAFLLLNDGYF